MTGAIAAGDKKCATCHPSADADHVAFHATATPAVGCQATGCHPGTNLLPIHSALTCAQCHSSSNPIVIAAIAASDTRCATCHPNADADHIAFHATVTPAVACQASGCHPGTNLLPIHSAVTCAGCHSSSNPTVIAAIAAGDKSCATCHPNAVNSHITVHATVTPAVACQASGCHPGTNLLDIHNAAHGAFTCARCHSSVDPIVIGAIAAGDKRCATCHPNADHAPLHTTVDPPVACQASGCHPGTNLLPIHSPVTCAGCHESVDPIVIGAIAAGDKQCATCHPGGADHAPLHDTTIPTGCLGAGCHAAATNLIPIHNAIGCGGCHDSTDPNVVNAIATGNKDCGACHPGGGDHAASHEDALSTGCQECHKANIAEEHENNCDKCHASTDPAVIAAIAAGHVTCEFVSHPGIPPAGLLQHQDRLLRLDHDPRAEGHRHAAGRGWRQPDESGRPRQLPGHDRQVRHLPLRPPCGRRRRQAAARPPTPRAPAATPAAPPSPPSSSRGRRRHDLGT